MLKEDHQAFGISVDKAVTLEEAITFPITSVPLNLSTPDGSLRQYDKANLGNCLIKEADAID